MPRLADFSRRAPKVEVRVVASSKMVDAGALDSSILMNNLDLREETSGVEIHLGSGDYPGYRADKLFEVSMAVVANPELVKSDPPLKSPEDLARHVLLHDDAMDLVAGGDAWRKWLEAAHAPHRGAGSPGPPLPSHNPSPETAPQRAGGAPRA